MRDGGNCCQNENILLPQTPDPASGKTWGRKFVPQDKILEYLPWKVVGEAMFRDAVKLNNK